VKRDKSRSETDFGVFGNLWGLGAIGKTARKLGIFWPQKAHPIDSHWDAGGEGVYRQIRL